jgi:hypothetical protein
MAFVLVELIRGKKVDKEAINAINATAFLLLLCLSLGTLLEDAMKLLEGQISTPK